MTEDLLIPLNIAWITISLILILNCMGTFFAYEFISRKKEGVIIIQLLIMVFVICAFPYLIKIFM